GRSTKRHEPTTFVTSARRLGARVNKPPTTGRRWRRSRSVLAASPAWHRRCLRRFLRGACRMSGVIAIPMRKGQQLVKTIIALGAVLLMLPLEPPLLAQTSQTPQNSSTDQTSQAQTSQTPQATSQSAQTSQAPATTTTEAQTQSGTTSSSDPAASSSS